MKRKALSLCAQAAAAAVALSLAAPAGAHHSYAAFDREKSATISGVIERIAWANPHVMLKVRTDKGASYEVLWNDLSRLQRQGVLENPFEIGDRIVVSGAPARDPDERALTLITEVRRPADDWTWTRASGLIGYMAPATAGRMTAHGSAPGE